MEPIRQALPQDQSAVYRIQVDGQINEGILDWFDDVTVSTETGADGRLISSLAGPVADQAALHGLLSRLYTFGFVVVAVTRVEQSGTGSRPP